MNAISIPHRGLSRNARHQAREREAHPLKSRAADGCEVGFMMAFAVTVELVHHFKWIKGVQSKLNEREDGFRSQHLRWWVQSARVLRHIEVTAML